jgi:hypothetical protein
LEVSGGNENACYIKNIGVKRDLFIKARPSKSLRFEEVTVRRSKSLIPISPNG